MNYTKLPKCEIWCYWTLWVSGVSYSIYHVYLTGNLFSHYPNSDDFATGWSFLGRKKDVSDYEWVLWINLLRKMLPWICLHFLVGELFRKFNKQMLPHWYLVMSAVCMVYHIGVLASIYILLHPCVLYILTKLMSRVIIWMAVLTLLVLHNMDSVMLFFDLPDEPHYLLSVCLAWVYLRCLSFCLDKVAGGCGNPTFHEFIKLLAYCTYLPTLFLGPLILYQEFHSGVSKPYISWTLQRCLVVALNLCRFIGWIFITELALHFIYSNALMRQPEVVKDLGAWSLYGLGYCMGQFFMLKYVVVYGLAGTVAQAEQITAPHHPKCIARIHLYSDMWRYFDQGLYLFLIKYIYIPSIGEKPSTKVKFLASFVCFCFIFIWHRIFGFILVWSVLNFFGVTVEGFSKHVASLPVYQQLENQLLKSPENCRRFHAVLAMPLFIMSALSNFYFFGEMAIGNIFVQRLFAGSLQVNCILFFFSYCCCQVSIEVKNWELNGKRNLKMQH